MILAAWYHPVLATLFAFICVVLIGVILLQRGRGVGLAGAFGGAGGQQAFGAKTGDFLTWATIFVACVFLIAAVLLNYVFVPPPAPRAAPVLQPGLTPTQTQTPAPAAGDAAPPVDSGTTPPPATDTGSGSDDPPPSPLGLAHPSTSDVWAGLPLFDGTNA